MLSQFGLDRITGLAAYLPDRAANRLRRAPPANDILGNTTTLIPLDRARHQRVGAGNILLGGGGSDRIEGRGADDIIDGDTYMNVRLSVRTDVNDPATEIGTTPSLENIPTGSGWNSRHLPASRCSKRYSWASSTRQNSPSSERFLLPEVPEADCGADVPLEL